MDAGRKLHGAMIYINSTSAEQYVGMSAPTNVTVSLTIDPCTMSSSSSILNGTFVASSDGAVSMLAEHAIFEPARNPSSTPTYLEHLPNYGLLGSAITFLPPTANSIPTAHGPSLAFPFLFPPSPSSNATSFNVTLWLSPILNYRDKRPLRYVLELDDDPASRVKVKPVPENITPGTNSVDWGNVVSANIRKVTTMLQSDDRTEGGKRTVR